MPRATKILIVKSDSTDETFMLTRKITTKQIIETTQETDENAEVINQLRVPDPISSVSIDEELYAVGVQSRQSAKVIILETTEGITKDGLTKKMHDDERPQSIRIDNIVRPGEVSMIDPSKIF